MIQWKWQDTWIAVLQTLSMVTWNQNTIWTKVNNKDMHLNQQIFKFVVVVVFISKKILTAENNVDLAKGLSQV